MHQSVPHESRITLLLVLRLPSVVMPEWPNMWSAPNKDCNELAGKVGAQMAKTEKE
jgi:hypothetical protein